MTTHSPADAVEEENELAERILRWLERLRPHMASIGIALLAVAAAVVGWILVSGQNEATRAQTWDSYLAALSTGEPGGFQEVIARYPESTAASWSRLVLGELSLREGTDLAFLDRARSKARLEVAAQLFKAVLGSRPEGMLAERAVYGLAKALESSGQLEEARNGYKAVASEYPDDVLVEIAKSRAEALGKESTRKWYDWFEAQDVTPPKPPAADQAATKEEKVGTKSADQPPPEAEAAQEPEPTKKPGPTQEPEAAKAPAAVGDFPPAAPEKAGGQK